MKLSAVILLTIASDAKEKKVPPRHPGARLATLNRFIREWLSTNFAPTDSDDKRGARLNSRFLKRFRVDRNLVGKNEAQKNWGTRLRHLVGKRTGGTKRHPQFASVDCFGYDPANEDNHGVKERKRREDSQESSDYQDYYDQYYDYSEYDTSSSTGDLVRYNKKNAIVGLRQIMTGFRKWSERYIRECPGEKKDRHSGRAKKMHKKILDQYKNYLDKQNSQQ